MAGNKVREVSSQVMIKIVNLAMDYAFEKLEEGKSESAKIELKHLKKIIDANMAILIIPLVEGDVTKTKNIIKQIAKIYIESGILITDAASKKIGGLDAERKMNCVISIIMLGFEIVESVKDVYKNVVFASRVAAIAGPEASAAAAAAAALITIGCSVSSIYSEFEDTKKEWDKAFGGNGPVIEGGVVNRNELITNPNRVRQKFIGDFDMKSFGSMA